jgi:hypothetical protein
MSLEKALLDVRKACQNLGFAFGAAYRRFVAGIGRCARRREPVIGFDLGAPGGDVAVVGRYQADEIAKFFGVPSVVSGRDVSAIFHTGLMAGVSINEFRGFKMTVPRRPTKQQRDSVFFAPVDLLIQPQGDKFAQDYASRVNVEAWNLCRRFGREPNNARPSVTRHIHKLTRYSQRALTGRG